MSAHKGAARLGALLARRALYAASNSSLGQVTGRVLGTGR